MPVTGQTHRCSVDNVTMLQVHALSAFAYFMSEELCLVSRLPTSLGCQKPEVQWRCSFWNPSKIDLKEERLLIQPANFCDLVNLTDFKLLSLGNSSQLGLKFNFYFDVDIHPGLHLQFFSIKEPDISRLSYWFPPLLIFLCGSHWTKRLISLVLKSSSKPRWFVGFLFSPMCYHHPPNKTRVTHMAVDEIITRQSQGDLEISRDLLWSIRLHMTIWWYNGVQEVCFLRCLPSFSYQTVFIACKHLTYPRIMLSH